MTEVELAWAAGLFEGEGSVRITKPAVRNWGILIAGVPNTDEALVRFFHDRWGGSVHYTAAALRRRGFWRWTLASKQAAAFLTAIRPYIVSERIAEKIDHGLDFQAQKQQHGRDEEYREDQWCAYWWMAHLNRRGVR